MLKVNMMKNKVDTDCNKNEHRITDISISENPVLYCDIDGNFSC